MSIYVGNDKNFYAKSDKSQKLFVTLPQNIKEGMISTEEAVSTMQDVSEHCRVVTEVERSSTVTTKTLVDKSYHSLAKGQSTRERIMASTMSVDEYFDELIDQVREDYANL